MLENSPNWLPIFMSGMICGLLIEWLISTFRHRKQSHKIRELENKLRELESH